MRRERQCEGKRVVRWERDSVRWPGGRGGRRGSG